MTSKIRQKLNIPDNHIFELEKTERIQRRGQDSDVFFYHQKDEKNNTIARFKITEYMSIYPPFKQETLIEKM